VFPRIEAWLDEVAARTGAEPKAAGPRA